MNGKRINGLCLDVSTSLLVLRTLTSVGAVPVVKIECDKLPFACPIAMNETRVIGA